MPRLKHTTPCGDCPMRRESTPGRLGAASPGEFLEAVRVEVAMPCHLTIDYADDDWEETQLPDAALCAGVLIYTRNTCKLPRDPELARACRAVVADRASVFASPAEFLEHHGEGE